MMTSSKNWRQRLVEAYPDLFHRTADALEGVEGSPECGAGWRDVLERACTRIRSVLESRGGNFRFVQIKEKYGSARLYWEGALSKEAKAEVEEAVDLAEARSACTCEQCGKPGRLFDRGGWLATACDEHGRGEPVPARTGVENLHVRHFGINGQQTVTCRRYDRETDSFIDVDSTILGMEEE